MCWETDCGVTVQIADILKNSDLKFYSKDFGLKQPCTNFKSFISDDARILKFNLYICM